MFAFCPVKSLDRPARKRVAGDAAGQGHSLLRLLTQLFQQHSRFLAARGRKIQFVPFRIEKRNRSVGGVRHPACRIENRLPTCSFC